MLISVLVSSSLLSLGRHLPARTMAQQWSRTNKHWEFWFRQEGDHKFVRASGNRPWTPKYKFHHVWGILWCPILLLWNNFRIRLTPPWLRARHSWWQKQGCGEQDPLEPNNFFKRILVQTFWSWAPRSPSWILDPELKAEQTNIEPGE